MPAIVNLVSALSSEIVADLATYGVTLTDGAVLLGSQYVAEQSRAPRIVVYPASSKWLPKSTSSAMTSITADERTLEALNRALITEQVTFRCHCWGVSGTTGDDPAGDYDATQVLYQSVIRVLHKSTTGVYAIGDLAWTDAALGQTRQIMFGREAVFTFSLKTPVLDSPLQAAPEGLVVQATTYLQEADSGNAPEVGCSDVP
jgi:hypothetical protein